MFSLTGRRYAQKCFKIMRLSFVQFNSKHDYKHLKAVRTVEKIIESNTTVCIESPIHVKVQPIDVNDIEAHQKLTMTLYSKGNASSDFLVKQSSKRLELLNKNDQSEINDICVIQMPYQLKVQVTTSHNADVEISKLESEEIIVHTDKGAIEVQDLKANTIKVDSLGGNIETNGRLQASSIELKTGQNSNIKCNNIMANHFQVATHAGDIRVKSCYSDKSHFTTLMGNIFLDHLHKSVFIDVIQQGNLQITRFAGSLKATLKSGDVYMTVSQLIDKSSIFIHEKGKVELLIPHIDKNLPATNLIAEEITVDDKIMKLGRFMDDTHPKRFRFEKEPHNELHIVCKNGSINLKESPEDVTRKNTLNLVL